jgi:hypothetical protein
MPQYITLTDFILLPFVFLIIYKIAVYLRNKHLPKGNPLRPYFVPALLLKVVGAVAFAMVYNFYYGYGDTFRYYDMGVFFTKILKDNPLDIFRVYLTGNDAFYTPKSFVYNFDYLYNHHLPNIIVSRISSFLGLFLFNNFLLITIGFSILSFTGLWKLFRLFGTLYPSLAKPLAFAILFLPSTIFWGSGILKDSLTIGAIGWFIYGSRELFISKNQITTSVSIVVLSGILLFLLKAYILVCLIPAIFIWIGNSFYQKINDPNYRKLVWVGFITIVVLLANRIEDLVNMQKRQIEELAKAALTLSSLLEGYEAGSSYNLGVSTGSIGSIMKASPMAIVTTLYRPFLWEVRNPVMLISALESSLILIATLYVFFKVRPIRFIRIAFTKAIILFCLIFSLMFSFGIALSSNNFGTLVRYKIPAIPLYLIALLLIYYYGIKLSDRKKQLVIIRNENKRTVASV